MTPRADYVIDRSRGRVLVMIPGHGSLPLLIRDPIDWRPRLIALCLVIGVAVGISQLMF